MTEPERFRKSFLGGRVSSSRGYSVRAPGRAEVWYEDEDGRLIISGELMGDRAATTLVDVRTIPDNLSRPRKLVVERLQRAFDFAGWKIEFGWEDA